MDQYPATKAAADAPKLPYEAGDGDDMHAKLIKHFEEAWEVERSNREAGLADMRFYAGDQWEEAAKKERLGDGRPCLVINRLPQFVKQVTGDLRRDTPAIKISPSGGKATVETAEIHAGIIRSIETQSDAKAAYITAIEGAAICGQGGWRVVTVYSDNDGFNQDIRIQRIADPFAVLIDPYAKEADKSDKRYAFVFEDMARTAFKAEYPEAKEEPLEKPPESLDGWHTDDTIRVAEAWVRKPVKETLYLMPNGAVTRSAKGAPPPEGATHSREVDTFVACMYRITAAEILSGPHEFPSKYIPIVPVYGEEVVVDGQTVRKGIVRDARDAQTIYNYARSTAVEAMSMQPKAPWLLTTEMIQGDGVRGQWDNAGRKNYPYLVYTPDPMAPGQRPERIVPPTQQSGLDTQAALASDDLKNTTGLHDASLGARSNETSGRAILARQREGDTATYTFPDNLARAIRFTGKVLVDMIPRVYDTERVVVTLQEDGTEDITTINGTENVQGEDGQEIARALNDVRVGEYMVTVRTGPSFATRRAEASESMMEIIRAQPALFGVAGDLLVKAMDWPGSDQIAERLKRTMPPQLVAGKDEPPPPEPPPDPMMMADVALKKAQALREAANVDLTSAQIDKTMAETEKAQADAGKAKAELGVMLGQIEAANAEAALTGLNGMPQRPGAPPEPPPMPAEPQADPPAEADPFAGLESVEMDADQMPVETVEIGDEPIPGMPSEIPEPAAPVAG